MFAGHYGVSFAAKGVDRTIPLWVLFLARRPSVSAGNGISVADTTANVPQRLPSTMTGTPTDERQPMSRAAAGAEPGTA